MADAQRVRGVLGGLELFIDLDQRRVAHDTGQLQHQLALYLLVLRHDNTAVILHDAVDRKGHILRVRADDDDVMRVVGDRRCDRAGFQAVALNIAEADMVRILVPLDDGDLENVLLRVHLVGVAVVGGDDLAGDHADDRARTHVAEVVLRQRRDVEGVVGALVEILLDLRLREVLQLAVVVVQHALLKDHFHVEVLEIVNDGEVGQIAGRDGAAVVEQEVARGVMAGGLDGDDRIDAVFVDGLAADVVNVALFEQVARVLVVGAEHAAVGVLRREQRRERLKIAGGGALADHDELAAAELRQRVLDVGALMVGVDARGDVGVKILARQARRVAVDLLVVRLRGDDLRDDLRVVVDDAVGVHHLGKALHSRVVVERVDGAVVEVCAGFVHRRRRNAGRQHEPHIDRQALGGLEHVVDAVGTHDVGDLVGVGNDGGRAMRQDGLRKFTRRNKTRLEMDVRIDEARADDLAGHVQLLFALIFAHADDQAVCNRDIAGTQLIGEYVHIGRVLEHQIGLFPAGGRLDHALLFQQLSLNFSCIAFHGSRHCKIRPFVLSNSCGLY